MKSRLHHLPWLLVAALAVAGALYAYWPRAVPVDVGTVIEGPMRVTVDEDGKTRVKDRFVVSAPLAGLMSRILLKSGDKVEAGTTLLTTIEPEDPALLDARARSEAEARVRAAEANRAQAATHLEEVRETHDLAVHEYDRAKALVPSKAIAQGELDRAEHEERRTAQAVRSADLGLQVAQFELELAQAALIRTRPADPATATDPRLEVRSPITGQVLRVLQESSRVVTAGLPLVELGNSADLEVEIDVLSSDAAGIRPGAPVILEHWGGSQPLDARVRLVEPSGFTKVSALGVEEQRVNVIADLLPLPQADATLGDAFRVEARVVVWQSEAVLKVPAGALFRHRSKWAVFTIEQSIARLRTIEIGHHNSQESEVLHGLTAGAQVILHPGDKIVDGTRVVPR